MNFIIRDNLTDDNLETITLEISKPKAKPFLINSWYKPSNTTLEIFNAFEDLITRMDSENKEIILLGDYNSVGLAWIVTALTLRQTSLLELHIYFNFNN
jgi:exonuclease III